MMADFLYEKAHTLEIIFSVVHHTPFQKELNPEVWYMGGFDHDLGYLSVCLHR